MMKSLTLTFILSLAFLCGQANAVTLGHQGYVVFSDGTAFSPYGESPEQCKANMEALIEAYLARNPGVEVRDDLSLPCGPRNEDISDIGFIGQLLPIVPQCLSCPLLGPETFDILFPSQPSAVERLYYQYGINHYNQQLLELQQQYDLRNFQKKMYLIQRENQ